ncbi:MAG: MotA/TolQ/ExbB proton channel family protein [Polyangiales bacterium]
MIDIQERLTAFAMLGATWVMWLLIFLSVIGVAIIFERVYYFFSSREDVRKLQEDLRLLLAKNDIGGARERLGQSKSFQAKIVYAGVEVVDEGADSVEERLAGATSIARTQMERNLGFLGTVGNNAPFVGLLGTVIGVIRAFHALDQSAGKVTSGLMAEVGEALVATAIGLLVALPAVAFFNFFQRLIRYRLTWADALGRDLLAYMKGSSRKGQG